MLYKTCLVNMLENIFVFIEILFKMLLFKVGVLIYAEHCTYCGCSEFKCLVSVIKNECSIMLENKNPPAPNPTLNLLDSVNECKSDIKGIH